MADANSEFNILSYLDVNIPERPTGQSDPGSGSKILRLTRGSTPSNYKPEMILSPSTTPQDSNTPRRKLSFSPRGSINPITGVEKKPPVTPSKPLSFDDWVEARGSPSASPRNPRTPTLNLGGVERPSTPKNQGSESPKILGEDDPECDLCTNTTLIGEKERKKQEDRENMLYETIQQRERLMNETMGAQQKWEELRQQRVREYKDEMSRIQDQRSEVKRVNESENSRDREKIDRLRQGLDDVEFQQFAQQRKQEYIRDLLNQMELSKTNKVNERELEKQFQNSAILGGEDPEEVARRKSEYKSMLQSQMEYRKRAKEESKNRELEEERSLQDAAERKAAKAVEEQERRKREIRRQFGEYTQEDARIKENRLTEKSEQERREKEQRDSYIQAFHVEQDEITRETRERGKVLHDTLTKQMELNANKRQLEKYEDHHHHSSSVLPERNPELVVCKSCNKALPTTRFKGTPNNTLVKILQKYAQQTAKKSATYNTPSRLAAPYEQVSLNSGKVANTPYYISPYTLSKRPASATFASTY